MQAKPDKHPPSHLKLGAGAHYIRLDTLADLIGTTDQGVRKLIGALGLPIVHIPETGEARYVLSYALETAMFAIGMPKGVKDGPGLLRAHQELAGVLYGSLTKEALRDRVKQLVSTLTSASDSATMKKGRRKRSRSAHQNWTGRTPSA